MLCSPSLFYDHRLDEFSAADRFRGLPGSLKTISTVSKSVSTMYRDNTYQRTYLLQDPETGDIYLTFQHGV